jgi:hypothetical protein
MDQRAPTDVFTDVAVADDVEAWGIAVDLIADLGAPDAIAWANDYMSDLENDSRSGAIARWTLVTDALARLTRAKLH